jgi:integrase/recombinase XerD
MTRLRRMMLEELQRRNYSEQTSRYYLQAVTDFARHFGRSPDKLGLNELRSYQAYLLRDRKLAVGTVVGLVAALRFFFNRTLKRHLPPTDIPYPKHPRRLPAVLSVEEVARLIDSARNLLDRTLLMVLYSTGMRNFELRELQVKDIDSKSMLIHIQRGKGGRDRYVPLSPKLLETLREYWRWMKPKTWLFPGTIHNWRADKPLTPKVVWDACQFAARRAGICRRFPAHWTPCSFPVPRTFTARAAYIKNEPARRGGGRYPPR